MYEKFMKKYGRAIDSENERETLYGLYKARNITLICTFLSWCLLIVSALFVIDTDDQENLVAFVLVFALLIVIIALLIILVVFAIKFQVMYSKILTRAPQEGETPEVVSYRKKVVAAEKRAKKSNVAGKIFLGIGCVVSLTTLVYDAVKYPDSDEPSAMFWFGTVFFAICLAVFMFGMIISKSKAALSGETMEIQTADESAAIDEKNGIKHKYSIQTDKNLNSINYLFPNHRLHAKYKSLQRLQSQMSMVNMWISIIFAAVIVVIFSAVSGTESYRGYACPIYVTSLFVANVLWFVPYAVLTGKLEKLQKQEFEKYPIYAKNAEIFRLYEEHSKGKGKVILIFLILSLICGWTIAILSPDKLYAALSILILFAGIFLNSKFVSELRQKVIPIEKEIDNARDKIKFTVDTSVPLQEGDYITCTRCGNALVLMKTDSVEVGWSTLQLINESASDCSLFDAVLPGESVDVWLEIKGNAVTAICGEMPPFDTDIPSEELEESEDSEERGEREKNADRCEISVPQSDLCGVLKIDCEGGYPPHCTRTLDFPQKYAYDAEKRILQFGEADENATTYRVFKNVYVDLTAEGELKRVTIADVGRDDFS